MIEDLDGTEEPLRWTSTATALVARVGRGRLLAVGIGALVGLLAVTPFLAVAPTAVEQRIAPTPQVAAGPLGSQPFVRPNNCRAQTMSGANSGPVFIALADQGSRGVAFILSATTGAHVARIDIAGTPEAALDGAGRQLLVLCGSELVSYDLATLHERWRVAALDRQLTKAPGGIPALSVSRDGRLVVLMHYKALRPGDANAPGASRYWLTAHHARTGAALGELELPDCGVGSVHASRFVVYVLCRDGIRVIDTNTWAVARTYDVPVNLRPTTLVADTRLYGVTRELRVVGVDLTTGKLFEDSSGAKGATANAWGRLAISADGCCLWVLAKRSGAPNEFGPDTIVYIDLARKEQAEAHVPDLRGVGVVGSRMVYVSRGQLHSTDGKLDSQLLTEPVEFWHILSSAEGQ